MDETQKILHSPFDIETHKNHFINYLEVVILEDGTVEYAVPSHQMKLEELVCNKYNCSKEEIWEKSSTCCDYLEWLISETNAVSVWNDFYVGNLNECQRKSLNKLKSNNLYYGKIYGE